MFVFVCRMFHSAGGWYRPQNTHAALLDKYWTKLQIGNMAREELKKVRRLRTWSNGVHINFLWSIIWPVYPLFQVYFFSSMMYYRIQLALYFITSFILLMKFLKLTVVLFFACGNLDIICNWSIVLILFISLFNFNCCCLPVQVLVNRYPNLTVVVERLLDIYCQLTGERHPDLVALGHTDSLHAPEVSHHRLEDKTTSLEGRGLSLR